MVGYTKNYIYIYTTQALSMMLGLLSLFVVIPFLASNKEVYGIYTICTSLTIFFSYADIGFITSGQKFASEAYIQNDKEKELKILGFSAFILFSFLCLISLGILVLAYRPTLLIHNLSVYNESVASNLLLILACSFPIYCFQRIGQILYSVRMSDYLFHILQIVGSLMKLLSVFYFFRNGEYDIVGYYLTIQAISLIVVIVAYWQAWKKYQLRVVSLIRNMKYESDTYHILKGLAFASLFGTACWILYYELDNIVISKLLGAEAVAIYAIAFSILTMFRSVFGSFYAPYTTRFNYFMGLGDINGLNAYTKRIMEFFIPFCLIPITVMVLSAKPFVYSWVGTSYDESVQVLSYLLFCNILAFISYPSSLYITARQCNKYLYISSAIIVVVFWSGVILSYKYLGVTAFAVMKSLGMILSAIYSFIISFKIMNDSYILYIRDIIKRNIFPAFFCATLAYITAPYMQYSHNKESLMINITIIIITGIVSYICFFICNSVQRKEILQAIYNFRK